MHSTIYKFGYIATHDYYFTIVLNGKTTVELVKVEQFKTLILNNLGLTVGFLLLQYSVVYTAESLSGFNHPFV